MKKVDLKERVSMKWTEYKMRNSGRKVSEVRQVAKTSLQTQSRISSNKAIQGATVLPSGILKFPKLRMK